MQMVQRKFYLPEEMYRQLQFQAKIAKKSITDVLRELVNEGLKNKNKKPAGRGIKGLLGLVALAEKDGLKGPVDLAEKHNRYFNLG